MKNYLHKFIISLTFLLFGTTLFSASVTFYATEDNFVQGGTSSTTVQNPDSGFLVIRHGGWSNNVDRRSVIKFDFSGYLTNGLTNARFVLTKAGTKDCGDLTAILLDNDNWRETTVTYQNLSTNGVLAAIGAWNSLVSDTPHTFYLHDAVKTTLLDDGIMSLYLKTLSTNYDQARSSEDGTISRRPRVELLYSGPPQFRSAAMKVAGISYASGATYDLGVVTNNSANSFHIIFTNTSAGEITLFQTSGHYASVSGTGFSRGSGDISSSLQSKAAVIIPIDFSSSTEGTHNGSILISNNTLSNRAYALNFTVSVSANGTPPTAYYLTNYAIEDNFVKGAPSNNVVHNPNNYLMEIRSATWNTSTDRRGVIKFDLGGYLTNGLTGASLKLTKAGTANCGDLSIVLLDNNNWSETNVTYANLDTNGTLAATGPWNSTTSGTLHSFDILNAAKTRMFLDGVLSLYLNKTTIQIFDQAYTSEDLNINRRPRIELSFSAPPQYRSAEFWVGGDQYSSGDTYDLGTVTSGSVHTINLLFTNTCNGIISLFQTDGEYARVAGVGFNRNSADITSSLSAKAGVTIPVRFSATAEGTYAGVITISNNTLYNKSYTLNFSAIVGTGVTPPTALLYVITNYAIEDNFVKGAPSNNIVHNPTNRLMEIRSATWNTSTDRRAVIKFDLGEYLTNGLTNVSLKLTKAGTANCGDLSIVLLDDNNWSENTVTYANLNTNGTLAAIGPWNNPVGRSLHSFNILNAAKTRISLDGVLSLYLNKTSLQVYDQAYTKDHNIISERPRVELYFSSPPKFRSAGLIIDRYQYIAGSRYNFGELKAGVSKTINVVFTNTSPGIVSLYSVGGNIGGVTGTGFFRGATDLPTTLSPFGSSEIEISFVSEEVGDFIGSLVISNNTRDSKTFTLELAAKVVQDDKNVYDSFELFPVMDTFVRGGIYNMSVQNYSSEYLILKNAGFNNENDRRALLKFDLSDYKLEGLAGADLKITKTTLDSCGDLKISYLEQKVWEQETVSYLGIDYKALNNYFIPFQSTNVVDTFRVNIFSAVTNIFATDNTGTFLLTVGNQIETTTAIASSESVNPTSRPTLVLRYKVDQKGEDRASTSSRIASRGEKISLGIPASYSAKEIEGSLFLISLDGKILASKKIKSSETSLLLQIDQFDYISPTFTFQTAPVIYQINFEGKAVKKEVMIIISK